MQQGPCLNPHSRVAGGGRMKGEDKVDDRVGLAPPLLARLNLYSDLIIREEREGCQNQPRSTARYARHAHQ